MTVLRLNQLDLAAIELLLKEMIAQAPEMFNRTPVILDLQPISQLEGGDFDATLLFSMLRLYGLQPIAVRNGNPQQMRCAITAGVGVLEGRGSRSSHELTVPSAASTPMVVRAAPSKLVAKPVHSGQQIYAGNGRDLIVLGSVSPGAEVLADGSIHVYGALRGRALAGVQGDAAARIFCQTMGAELVSIAGCYQLLEDATVRRNEPTQVYLDGEKIKIEKL